MEACYKVPIRQAVATEIHGRDPRVVPESMRDHAEAYGGDVVPAQVYAARHASLR